MLQLLFYIAAGIVAGGVFIAVFLLGRPRIATLNANPQWQRFGAAGIAAVVAAIVFAIGIVLIGSSPSKEQEVLKEIRSYRFVQVLEQYQPGARAQIEAMVHEAVSKNDPGIAQSRTSQLVQQYFPQYVPRTSDDAITSFAKSLVDILTYFEANDVETCKTLATGGRLTTDISRERMNPVIDSMADVIEAAATKPQAPPDAAHAQPLIQSVVSKLYAGKDPKLVPIEMLTTPQSAPADKLCHTMQSFYRAVLTLPKADASIVLRQLIGGAVK